MRLGQSSLLLSAALFWPDARYVSSYVRWTGPRGKERRIGKPWKWPQFQRYMVTAHVGSMHHRELFEVYGNYDASLRIVADYEFLLRAGAGLKAAFLPVVTAVMRGGGVSDSLVSIDETTLVKVRTGKRNRMLARLERVAARLMFCLRRGAWR